MKKFMLFVVALIILCPLFSGTTIHAAEGNSWLDESSVSKGIISVKYDVKANIKTKLLIVKGQEQYYYNLIAGKQVEVFPLQLGNGDYTVSLLEQTSGNKYQVVYKDTIKLALSDSSIVYLNSTQNVNWNDTSKAVQKAKELTKNLATDAEKVKVIYNYVINNIKYDNKLAVSASADYLPQIDRTFSSKKDICYGYSALFAAMLRSVDVPTKMVMGTTNYVSSYHAWNEVYLNNKWVTVDTTVDAGWNGTTTTFMMVKDASKYLASKQY
ncbi:transglutaminase-like domain-containing protein [Paenibacillus sp. IHBB 10380]|uniref:transglutaminase-like domain-containing protein n=1 Tax=Paenibacillus sp. IHBB 10380 TaxID=1566358 RepID=UPI0005CFC663|nr:transglutaminase-like domain-containing protein [Paenibacillus sp. IHBB 10380]AJS60198.1 transglutaminase [Paenibacillus sp. IHBB 10380]